MKKRTEVSLGPECERDGVRREGKYTKLSIIYLCSRACFFIANTQSCMVNIPHSSGDALYHRSYHLWHVSHLVQQRPSLPGKYYGDSNIKVTF